VTNRSNLMQRCQPLEPVGVSVPLLPFSIDQLVPMKSQDKN
jgi:hypothetical protein